MASLKFLTAPAEASCVLRRVLQRQLVNCLRLPSLQGGQLGGSLSINLDFSHTRQRVKNPKPVACCVEKLLYERIISDREPNIVS